MAHRHIRDTAALPLDRELMGTQWENIISHLALIYESTCREAQQQGSSRHIRAEADDKGRTRKLLYSKHILMQKEERKKIVCWLFTSYKCIIQRFHHIVTLDMGKDIKLVHVQTNFSFVGPKDMFV